LRFAAIDIGSNAIRLLIADILRKDVQVQYSKNTLLRVPLRLGDEAFVKGEISEAKFEDMVKTMRAFRDLMDVYKVSDYMACATSAMRDAKNGKQIVQACRDVGVDIQIIDGSVEAKIIYNAYLSGVMDKEKVYLYVDVGGGSTEVSLFAKGELKASKSFNLGTIRILDGQDTPEIWQDLKEWVKTHTSDHEEVYGIGTGGNINKLSRLVNNGVDKAFGYKKLQGVYEHLKSLSLEERIFDLGLRSDRADVIIPAAEIYLTIMKAGKLRNIVTPRVGLADGIIQQLIRKNYVEIISN